MTVVQVLFTKMTKEEEAKNTPKNIPVCHCILAGWEEKVNCQESLLDNFFLWADMLFMLLSSIFLI